MQRTASDSKEVTGPEVNGASDKRDSGINPNINLPANRYYDGLESMRTGSDFMSEGNSEFKIFSVVDNTTSGGSFKRPMFGQKQALERKVAEVDDFDFSCIVSPIDFEDFSVDVPKAER